MTELTPAEQAEAQAIGQAILNMTAGHRVPVGFYAQLNALATSIAGIMETREEAEAFVDSLAVDVKNLVRQWHGTIETLGPAPKKKHKA